ncbi:hypothetical protein PoB_007702200 [Plakobranchus ocellatus]|uniref:Uncharacterized protein n=1 Tax=Plakobranchus ocellatus TaxID=259542 RepID=A0AAV4E1R7_9GAST|nr:hypothetical protein PoB_007702200 [Plakobranchus ocellatus]
MLCPVSLPLSPCSARSVFHCHHALSGQSSIVTMLCPVSIPLSRSTGRSIFHCHDPCLVSIPLSRSTARSISHCHDPLPDIIEWPKRYVDEQQPLSTDYYHLDALDPSHCGVGPFLFPVLEID